MITASVSQIQQLLKCSNSAAKEFRYADLHKNRKIYLNKGNYAKTTIAWLVKHYDIIPQPGNDAPKGGVKGDYVFFEETPKFKTLVILLEEFDAEVVKRNKEGSEVRAKQINDMVISEEEKQKFLQKTKGLSNKQARKVAHNYAAKILGFYSTDGMQKFYKLLSDVEPVEGNRP